MALGYRGWIPPRRLRRQDRALSWILGVGLGGVLLVLLQIKNQSDYHYFRQEDDRHLHRRFVEQLLELHGIFRTQSGGPERFLSGYFTAGQIETDIRSAYAGAIDNGFLGPDGYVDHALVLHYLEDPDAAAMLERVGENRATLEDSVTHYLEAAQRFIAGDELTPAQETSISEREESWWRDYLLKLDKSEPAGASGVFRRSVRQGAGYYMFWVLCLAFAWPAARVLVRGSEREWSPLLRRWHPPLVVAIIFWAVIGCQWLSERVFASPLWWQGSMYYFSGGLQYLVLQAGPVLVAAIFLMPGRRSFFKVFGLSAPRTFSGNHLGLALGLLGLYELLLYGFVLLEIQWGSFDTRDILSPGLIDTGVAGLLASGFSAVILAPVFEEILFRGFLFGSLRYRMAPWIAAVLSSVLFAILHYYSVMGMISVGIFGLMMCLIYERTRSLWPGILVHAFFNLQITLSSWYLYSEKFGWYGAY